VREMFRLADARACRHQAVTRYLGERIDTCGSSCDVCARWDVLAEAAAVPESATPRIRRGRSPWAASSGATASGREAQPLDDLGAELFVRLRALRKQLADARAVPAYVVFSDATLVQMAERRPRTEAELLEISGVGPKKVEQYGAAFLSLLAGR
jgi:ATP-dependent DNA helicase RecQ